VVHPRRTIGDWFRGNRDWLAVAFFAAVVFFVRSWEGDLDNDPIHYAAVSKNIVTTGEWAVLQDQPGEPFANKPPLMMWLTAVNFRLFGPSTYAAKFWSCAFGVGVAVMVCLLGRRLFSAPVGVLAGCVMTTFRDVLRNTVDLRLESGVTLLTVLTVYAVVRAIQEDRPRWLIVTGLAAGIGVMLKAVTPVHVMAVTILLLAVWRPRWLVNRWLLAGLGLGVLIAAPWHLYMWFFGGDLFSRRYVDWEISRRLHLGWHTVGNVGEELRRLVLSAAPWWPLTAWGAGYAVLRWRRVSAAERRGFAVCFLWIAGVFALMAVPSPYYPRYTIPAFPALALLAGYVGVRLVPEYHRASMSRGVVRIAAVAGLVLALAPVPLHPHKNAGFVAARPFIDRFDPGDSIACYYRPEEKKKDLRPEEGEQPRKVSSKTIYFLDRVTYQYHRPDDLDWAMPAFVIVQTRWAGDVEDKGYMKLMRLDREYSLMWRKCQSSHDNSSSKHKGQSGQ